MFLLQRGLQAGITIYAPAIILSTVLHWRIDLTILLTGLVVIVYTAAGGSQAVNCDAEIPARRDLLRDGRGVRRPAAQLPAGVGLDDALTVAGGFHKLEAVDFSLDASRRYTFWSGPAGGLLPGAVVFRHRPVAGPALPLGGSLRESRLGLMFNAVFKIPMQFFILLLGALVFVFYQFEPPPVFFNQAVWESAAEARHARAAARRSSGCTASFTPRSGAPSRTGSAPGTSGDRPAEAAARVAGPGRP